MTNNAISKCCDNYINNGEKEEDFNLIIEALKNNEFYILECLENKNIRRVYKNFNHYKKKNLKYKKDISIYINRGTWYILIFMDKDEFTNINKNTYDTYKKVSFKEFYKIIKYDFDYYDCLIINPMHQEVYVNLSSIYNIIEEIQ